MIGSLFLSGENNIQNYSVSGRQKQINNLAGII
jgi:hypothetical protein